MMMRILCLHGGNSSAAALRADMIQLESRLYKNHQIELVYANSPICEDGSYAINDDGDDDTVNRLTITSDNAITLPEQECTEEMKKLTIYDNSTFDDADEGASLVPIDDDLSRKRTKRKIMRRKWFQNTPVLLSPSKDNVDKPQSKPSGSDESCYYVGMDASIFHLIQIWNRDLYSRPFCGIIAFDQGAALAGILPLLGKKFPGLDFLVLADGYVLDPPPSRGCMGISRDMHVKDCYVDNVETLHLIGKGNNRRVSTEQSKKLAKRFLQHKIHKHSVDVCDRFPNRPKDLNAIGQFLISHKNAKRALLGPNGPLILETQRQLHGLSEHATNLICQAAGANPPKALMAVIAPNALGGWSGPKVRDPTDGGGAPCPKEFVMREKERRVRKPTESGKGGVEKEDFETASRDHPNKHQCKI